MAFSGNPDENWDHEMIQVNLPDKNGLLMNTDALFNENWVTLKQVNFWKQIMLLDKDSVIVNIASNRDVVEKLHQNQWNNKTEEQKSLYKDSVRLKKGLPIDERIFITSGKKHFYQFENVYPSLNKGILAFDKNKVDPWYAQAILLIESPGQLLKSNSGAYGPFQLMPGVARMMGLTVNKSLDERADFYRSAYAASSLIKQICIPEAKKILDSYQISYNEKDLWFRLFVMHVYHAGATNVRNVINVIQPSKGGQDLILQMWKTTSGGFANASQNYTQLVLASHLILTEMVDGQCSDLFSCE
ncbi:MAG: hypothetical protein HYU67_10640 [Flavobacteriia bacterium]|nr:hypothetical protein [Flavobacteriia bacterium]